MSTLLWPTLATADTNSAAEESTARELEWLLQSLQQTLRSLKAGLQECATLLAPQEPGTTLALSSHRSEALKGFITRVGNRIVKGDIYLRLPSLPPPKGHQAYRASISQQPIASVISLRQLASTRTLINSCLDVIDATQWTGDSKNPNFILGQLRLLHDNIQEAKAALTSSPDASWTQDFVDAKAFHPSLPPHVTFHLSIADAAVILVVRTLESADPHTGTNTPLSALSASFSGYSVRERLATALGAARPALHDEADEIFTFRGQDVKVRDKIRVESQDPSLMAALAKLAALDHSVAVARRALDIVMGKESDD